MTQNDPGSISSALARAHDKDIVSLTYTGVHLIYDTLKIPKGVTLEGKTTGYSSPQAIHAANDFPKNKPMIEMESKTEVKKVTLNARHIAEIGIQAKGKNDLTVIDSFIFNTRHDFSNETYEDGKGGETAGIYFYDCNKIDINPNKIFDIGVNKINSAAGNWFSLEEVTRGPKEDGNWFSTGTAIRVYKSGQSK